METAANSNPAAAEWVVTQGVPPTVGEVAATVLRAAGRPKDEVKHAVRSVSAPVLTFDEIEKLVYAHKDAPKWYRRVMRKQGRIDRLLREAAQNLLNRFRALPKAPGKATLKDAQAELDAVAELMRGERGPALLRRLRRPQCEINEHLSRAVAILVQWAIAPGRGIVPAGEEGVKTVESLRWHAGEAEHLSLRRKHRKPLVRRYKCDQYEINRCAIISIRKIAALFIKGQTG